MLMLPLASALAVAAFAVGESALLENGSFEKGHSGWILPERAWRVEDRVGYGGTKGLVWTNDDPTAFGFVSQDVCLEPGAIYRVRALVRADGFTGPKWSMPNVGCEGLDGDGRTVFEKCVGSVDDNGRLADGWKQYEGETDAIPAEACRGRVFCRMPKGCTGKVRFDDMVLERVPVKPIEFVVSSAFRNVATGETVRVLASVHANPATCAAKLAWTDRQGRRQVDEPVLFEADRVQFALDTSRLVEGTQDLSVSLVRRADGSVIASHSLAFTRTGSAPVCRVSFDSRRRMLLDGKPFFPVGHFVSGPKTGGPLPEQVFEDYAKAPFNFVMQYDGTCVADLDRWQKLGVCAAADARPFFLSGFHKRDVSTPDRWRAELRKALSEVGNHPSLVMWYLNDELSLKFVPRVLAMNDILREMDPARATLTCLCRPETAFAYLPSYDVMAHDVYPVGNHVGGHGKHLMQSVTRRMRAIDDNMCAMRPLWYAPQTFDWRWYYRGESLTWCDQEHLRMPTREEMSNMVWQGVANGANGIIAYSYSGLRQNLKGAAFDKAWADACAFVFEVKKMEPVLLSDDLPLKEADLPDGISVRAWRSKGRCWYLVVNGTRERMSASVPIPVRGAKFRTVLGRGATLSADEMSLDCDFGPLEYAFVGVADSAVR